MIILDTNVISELGKDVPDSAVRDWLNAQVAETLFLTTITIAEIRFGIAILAAGKRRTNLTEKLDQTIALFADRIFAFDANAALSYAERAVAARKAGQGLPLPYGYIAAVAAAHGFAVATRDVAPFIAGGVTVINPWEYRG